MNPKHYVPVLRWKDAEMDAIHLLYPEDRGVITPLIEITPKGFQPPKQGPRKGQLPNPNEVLVANAKELLAKWDYAPFFLDLGHIESRVKLSGGKHPLSFLGMHARMYKLNLIPVTGLNRSAEYQLAMNELCDSDERGACLRISADEIMQRGFKTRLNTLVKALRLHKRDVDFFLDYGVFNRDILPMRKLLDKIPGLDQWRSLIVCSGSFPPDLLNFQPGMRRIVREDWLNYKEQAYEQRIQRVPSFSDYTIQHGAYKEPPEFCNPSASIRYALEENWLVMRGEGLMNEDGPGSEQWNANAQLLCDHEDFKRFGPSFSKGDKYIFEMSLNNEKHGTPMTWLRAGINHHMTLTSRQIAGL
jgi:hypothetical protein